MKVLLINPPCPFLIDQKAFPPLGLLYLASALESVNIEVEVLDLANKEDILEETLSSYEADLYGITATTPQYPIAKVIKDIIKKKYKSVKVVVGGVHASSVPSNCLADGFDYVVVGEGEISIVDIAQGRYKTSCIVRSDYIKNIDSIKIPNRRLIDLKSYKYTIGEGNATTLITSRGCPFHCGFCTKGVWLNTVRYHSVNYILNELDALVNDLGYEYFNFLDDSFLLNKTRIHTLLACMEEDFDIKWRCYIRSDQITKDLLGRMIRAGCIEVGFGVESGSQKILDNVNKGEKIEDHTRAIQWCKELGLTTNVFLMIGLPGETRETVQTTKDWVTVNKPDKFGLNIFYPYLGTPIRDNFDTYDIKIHELSNESSWLKGRKGEYQAFVSTKELSREDILELHEDLFEHCRKITGWRTNWEGKTTYESVK